MEQDRAGAVLEFFIFQGHFEGFSFNCRLAISGFWVLDSGLGVLFASLGGNASSLYPSPQEEWRGRHVGFIALVKTSWEFICTQIGGPSRLTDCWTHDHNHKCIFDSTFLIT